MSTPRVAHACLYQQGYLQLYTGNGKGKTTAAFGLALRTLALGGWVYVGQFVKSLRYGEVELLTELDLPRNAQIDVELYGLGCSLVHQPSQADRNAAKAGCLKAKGVLAAGDYDLVILDELCVALAMQLLDVEEVKELIAAKGAHTELVLTGRYAPQWLIDQADLVTQMLEVKHYYAAQGVEARRGIER